MNNLRWRTTPAVMTYAPLFDPCDVFAVPAYAPPAAWTMRQSTSAVMKIIRNERISREEYIGL